MARAFDASARIGRSPRTAARPRSSEMSWMSFRPTASFVSRRALALLVGGACVLVAAGASAQPSSPHFHGPNEKSCGTGEELQAALEMIERARAGEWQSSALAGGGSPPAFGDVFAVEDDGSLTFFGITDSPRIVRRFYETWRDDFDFIAIYNDFDAVPEFGFAYNDPVLNTTSGIGSPIEDTAEAKRFPTARLLSYQNLNSLARYPDDPLVPIPGAFNDLLDSIEVLAHEVGHQWMARIRLAGGDLVGRNQVHWSFVLNVDGSVMEGNTLRDNGDGTFTTVAALETYSPLDQYLMGLLRREELPLQFVLENWTGPIDVADDATFPKLGVTLTGTRRDFGVADIETANGPRVPAAGDAGFLFRIAFVLLTRGGEFPPPPETLEKMGRIRLGYETFFRRETEGRGYLVSALCPPEAELRHRFTDGPNANALAGRSLAAGVDATGDGAPEFAAGAPGAGTRAGAALVFDGASGAPLLRIAGAVAGEELGASVALLRDADGLPGGELVAGAPLAQSGTGRVVVASVALGAPLYSVPGDAAGDEFGFALAALRDVDGDGRSDFAVGAPGANGGRGLVRLVSGADGSTIRTFPGASDGERFGESIASVSDRDGDGTADILVGSPGASPSLGLAGAGRASVLSIASGAVLLAVDGLEAGARFGAALASVPDASGDGAADFLVGAPGADSGRGEALLVSGTNGALLLRLAGSGPIDGFGAAVAGLSDANGDGRGDFVVGAPGARPAARLGAGAALVFSGADGGLLSVVAGGEARDALGSALAASGNEFAVGAPRESAGGAARVHALESFHLFSLGYPKRGTPISLEVWGEPGERYAIVASSRTGPAITPIPFPNGPGNASALDVGLERRQLTRAVPGFRGRLDAAGRVSVAVAIPDRADLVGRTVGFQAASLNGSGSTAPAKIRRLSRPVALSIR